MVARLGKAVGHRGALQPVGSSAGGRGGGLLRGARPRLARRREHTDRFHQSVGHADACERGPRSAHFNLCARQFLERHLVP